MANFRTFSLLAICSFSMGPLHVKNPYPRPKSTPPDNDPRGTRPDKTFFTEPHQPSPCSALSECLRPNRTLTWQSLLGLKDAKSHMGKGSEKALSGGVAGKEQQSGNLSIKRYRGDQFKIGLEGAYNRPIPTSTSSSHVCVKVCA